MTQIILDASASSKLTEAIQPVDLCDTKGAFWADSSRYWTRLKAIWS